MTPPLLFTSVPPERLESIRSEGLQAPSDEGILLHLLPHGDGRSKRRSAVLAVCSTLLDCEPIPANGLYRASRIPREAFLNLEPYKPVRRVLAAGGYLMRPGGASNEPELLLIHRRGVWDLPKGKLDPGESPEEAAVREVREEVGASTLCLLRSLGTTLHGYEEGAYYRAKTTYWFLMTTHQQVFTPELREGIDQVAWMPWSVARSRVGFPNLRAHMDRQQIDSDLLRGRPVP